MVKSDSGRKVLREGIAVKRDSGPKALRYGTLKVAESMGIGLEIFKASKGWVYDLKKRFKIALRTMTKVGRKLTPTEEDIVSARVLFLNYTIRTSSIRDVTKTI